MEEWPLYGAEDLFIYNKLINLIQIGYATDYNIIHYFIFQWLFYKKKTSKKG